MKVLFATSEIYPLNKTGGLGDVAYFLPKTLKKMGLDVRIIIPGFPKVINKVEKLKPVLTLENTFGAKKITVYKGTLPNSNLEVYVVKAPEYFDRYGNPYVDTAGIPWGDNFLRYALFSYITASFALGVTKDLFIPDIIHANDWQTALIAPYLHYFKSDEDYQDKILTTSVLTIHNLAHQGIFHKEAFASLELPENYFSIDGLEFYNKVNFLKGGIAFADKVTTVSPNYLEEIQTESYGIGLDGLIRAKNTKFFGILNGVDYSVWDPKNDKLIYKPYSFETIKDKQINKTKLKEEIQLSNKNKLLFGLISRLADQKGIDLVINAIPNIIEKGGQVAILGQGKKEYENKLLQLTQKYPDDIFVCLNYDEELAHKIFAASDIVMIPSRFEPCGLTQLYSIKYGTIPLARATGGLSDTIEDATLQSVLNNTATGLLFNFATYEDFNNAIKRAFDIYKDKKIWLAMQKRGMKQDFSWKKSAQSYIDLYNTQLDLDIN
jgi:starch synthase